MEESLMSQPIPVRTGLFLVLMVTSITACVSPPGPTAASRASSQAEPTSAPEPQRTLVMMINAEPDSLAGTALTARTGTNAGRRRLFNAGLVLRDGQNQPIPYLAESLPRLNTDSWRVLPDG